MPEMTKDRWLLWVLVWFAFLLPGLAEAQVAPPNRVLAIYYFHREPYYIKKADGSVSGFLMDITARVHERAGIPFVFEELPAKRILGLLEQGAYAGGVGWFRNPEREKFALFSHPIYQDHPLRLVCRKSTAREFPANAKLADILAGPWNIGLVDGFSYGAWADGQLKERAPEAYRITGLPVQLFKMIQSGRIDYTLVAHEEAVHLIRSDPESCRDLAVFPLADAPPGNLRHLMYSRLVGQGLLDQVNQSLAAFQDTDEYRSLTSFELE
jgi:polar amino acid transport system substrate-binding protein